MNQYFSEALDLINNSKNILLTTHESTDGDDFGTVSALALYLKQIGKHPYFCIKGGIPKQLTYLETSTWEEGTENMQYDLLVISGCSTPSRINIPWVQNLTIPKINFDHHLDSTPYATVNIIESSKSSVAELMFEFLEFAKCQFTAEIATALLTGIFTDTGSFMHSSTQSSTYKTAAKLLKHGANISKIAKWNYKNKNETTLKAWGEALKSAILNAKNKLIYAAITNNNIPNSAYEGLVETLVKAEEAKFSMLLKTDNEFIKGSLRSDPHKNIDVQKIAKSLGGGGHKWASGFKLKGKLKQTDSGIAIEK